MILSTPDELRLYLSTHVIDDIDNVRGAIDNSEHDFLRERIGAPLLKAVQQHYADTFIGEDGEPDDEAIQTLLIAGNRTPWNELIALCQRCIVFDAFARMANIQAVSVNNAGINVVDTKGYDNANDKTIAAYKNQMQREAHAAVNRLLIQLEEWQKAAAESETELTTLLDDAEESEAEETEGTEAEGTGSTDTPSATVPDESSSGNTEVSEAEAEAETPAQQISSIIALWQQSAYYYYVDGLLFNTASEFNLYVDIYDSREKFIQLLPDIRYCQETHIEEEIGEDLLADLIAKHKSGALNAVEDKLYRKLQRVLALQVEARNAMFKRTEAKDEASGHMKNTIRFIKANASQLDATAFATSPLYEAASHPARPSVDLSQINAPSKEWEQHNKNHDGDMLVTSLI